MTPMQPSIPQRPSRRTRSFILIILIVLLIASSAFVSFLSNRLNPTSAAATGVRITDSVAGVSVVEGFALWTYIGGTDQGNPPVVIVLGQAGQCAAPFLSCFRFLERDRRILIYDPRGMGNSQSKPSLSFYTISHLVDELDAIRVNVLRADSLVLLGHSFGGALALHYALRHPGEVDRLILISPLPPEGVRYNTVGELVCDVGDAIVKAGIPPSDESEANAWQTRYIRQMAIESLYEPSLSYRFGDVTSTFAPAQAVLTSLASGSRGLTAQLRNMHIPTLLAYGACETRWTQELYQQDLQRRLPNVHTLRFEQSGHWLFLEEPDKFKETVRAYLNTPKSSLNLTYRVQ